jgi:hypothetical protein
MTNAFVCGLRVFAGDKTDFDCNCAALAGHYAPRRENPNWLVATALLYRTSIIIGELRGDSGWIISLEL